VISGPWRHLTLLRTFGLLSALILVAIAAALAWSLNGEIERTALSQETALAESQAQTLLHAGLLPQRTGDALSPTILRHLAAYTAANLSYGGNVRVKIWSPDGTILYSDAPSAIGRRFPLEDDEDDVLAGRTPSNADISDLSAPENATERGRFRHLLEVYVPIRLASGRIVGLYEIYHNLDALDAAETALRHRIWLDVCAGFVVLYLSLFALVGSASRRLTHLLAETRRREADATLLYQVGERFRIDADRSTVLQGVLDAVCATFGYLSCALRYRSTDGKLYQQVGAGAQRGCEPPTGLAPGEGTSGRAAEERRIVIVPDVREEPRSAPECAETRAEMAVPLLVGDELLGVLSVESARAAAFGERDVKVLTVLADQVAMALQNARLFAQQEALYLALLETMARTIDARDPYTAGHSQRVAAYAVAIGRKLDLEAGTLRMLERGGLLHDIGKIGVEDAVLRKAGPLNAAERAAMERHPLIGYDLLRALPFLANELPLIRSHHERWDGRGYPDGLAGEAIPLEARIAAVADAFDAMTSDRPYRAGMRADVARERLLAGVGSQFWTPAVYALVTLLDAGELPGFSRSNTALAVATG
jgi:GAF domain-containing protein